MRARRRSSREAVPVTHPKRTVIRFPRGMVDGRVARCVDASGSPKYEYDERFTTLHFTPQEFRQFIRCLDDAGSPSTRRAKELALQQYRSQGGPNVGGLEYLQNPTIMGLSGTDILLGLGGLTAVGIVGYLVYRQQQTAQAQANAAAPALTSPELSYAATDINPPPPAVPVPPPPGGYPGTSPLPVPPS